jgi:cysteine sulfinate desulfinase/cysteine desulfurase-like protein
LIVGGHQEKNRRGGTESVPLIVGLGKACALAKKKLPDYDKTVRPLRDALEEGILSSIPKTELNGHKEQRLANTTNITLHGLESVALLILLDEKGISCLPGPKRDQPASRIPSRMSVAGFRRCRPVRLPTVYHPQTYRHKRLPVLCTGQ